MTLADYLPMTGDALGMTDGHVYLKQRDTFDPYVWGGQCMRIDEQTVALAKRSVTTRQAVGGGVERHQIRADPPGPSTFSLIMKRIQANYFKTMIMTCSWNVDHRIHCEGESRDSWNKWTEITRACNGGADERRMSGSGWEDTTGDALVTVPMTAMETVDIYRTAGEAAEDIEEAVTIVDVDVCHPARCPTGCNQQQDCRVAGITTVENGVDPLFYLNVAGGKLDEWTSTPITAWTSSANFVLCLGTFLVGGNTSETAIVRSDDWGVTQVEVDQTAVADWAANAPTQIDGIDRTYILICGNNGYIYRSTDAARTWETMDAGEATTDNLTRIMIARDNPQVAYAVGENAAIIKTENGGRTWVNLATTPAAGTIFGLYVKNQYSVIIVDAAADIFTTDDGGETWSAKQADPDGWPATITHCDIDACGCDEYVMIATDDSVNRVYRNVDGGADGLWYYRRTEHWEALPDIPWAVACCDSSRFVAVGGDGATPGTNFAFLAA